MLSLIHPLVLALMAVAILACLFPLLQRRSELGGLLLSPTSTLAKLIARPDWTWAFALFAIYGLLLLLGIFGQTIGAVGPAMLLPVAFLGAFLMMLFVYFTWVIRTLLIWVIARLCGERANFSLVLCTVGYAFMPEALLGGPVIALTTVFTEGTMGNSLIATSPLSLAYLMPALAASGPFVGSIVNQIDLFYLWSLALTALGIERIFATSRNKAALIVVCYWALSTVLLAGAVALSAQISQHM
jgi:hypothetical protein